MSSYVAVNTPMRVRAGVNTENKKGRMLADGTTTVYSQTHGREYESLFPVLNWTLLPGTTEVRYVSTKSAHLYHCAH